MGPLFALLPQANDGPLHVPWLSAQPALMVPFACDFTLTRMVCTLTVRAFRYPVHMAELLAYCLFIQRGSLLVWGKKREREGWGRSEEGGREEERVRDLYIFCQVS